MIQKLLILILIFFCQQALANGTQPSVATSDESSDAFVFLRGFAAMGLVYLIYESREEINTVNYIGTTFLFGAGLNSYLYFNKDADLYMDDTLHILIASCALSMSIYNFFVLSGDDIDNDRVIRDNLIGITIGGVIINYLFPHEQLDRLSVSVFPYSDSQKTTLRFKLKF